MMEKWTIALLVLLLLKITSLQGQEKIDSIYKLEKIKRSTSFAATTYGADILRLSGGSININNENFELGARYIPRLHIGGMHFWGHADMYVTFPIGLSLGSKPDKSKSYSMRESVESGLKVYPFAITQGKLRPYVGVSFQPFTFRYEDENSNYMNGAPTFNRMNVPLHLGLSYQGEGSQFNLGVRYLHNSDFNYYTDPTTQNLVNLASTNVNISFFKIFDSSKSLATENGVDQLNKKYHILKKENKLSSWYWGAGPSAALQVSKSNYFQKNIPYIYNSRSDSPFVPEISFGKHLQPLDANIGLAFRTMVWKIKGFDTEVKMSRTSLAFEPTKYLGDYHGFAPFIGPSIGLDRLSYQDNDIRTTQNKAAIGILFGWDIRLSKTETGLLRTNLRYVPNHHMMIDGEKVMFDHLEFNFIQFIKFIGRGKFYDKYRNNKK